MNRLASELRRECRVALSPRAQPAWFRLLKWTAVVALAVLYWRRPWFAWALLTAAFLGLGVHFFYRWKTCHWTRPWGGWDDLPAGRENVRTKSSEGSSRAT